MSLLINQQKSANVTFPMSKEQAKRFVASHPNLFRDVAAILEIQRSAITHAVRGRITAPRILEEINRLAPVYYRKPSPRRSRRASAPVPPEGVLAHVK